MARGVLLALESYGLLKLLYAQDMFSAFMWAAAKTLTHSVKGSADIRPEDTGGPDAWQSFRLRNYQLSKMAQDIQNTGLGSLEEIYMTVIPPLSAENRLPQPSTIVELARQYAKRHEQRGHWQEASDIYLWLFQRAKSFPKQSGISVKATAVLMEYLRQLNSTIELRKALYEDRQPQLKGKLVDLRFMRDDVKDELRTRPPKMLSELMDLYNDRAVIGNVTSCRRLSRVVKKRLT
jgi:hypothetical protein